MASAFAEIKRRGSISSGMQFDANQLNMLSKELLRESKAKVSLEAIALSNSDTADIVAVELRMK